MLPGGTGKRATSPIKQFTSDLVLQPDDSHAFDPDPDSNQTFRPPLCCTIGIMYEKRSNAGGEVDLAELRQARQRDSAPDIRQYRGVYMTRLILRVLSLLTCAAIIYVLVKSILDYRNTKDVTNPYRDGSGTFPVWPDNLTLYPSYILLGAAVFAGILSLILVVASFSKAVSGNVTGLKVIANSTRR